MQELPHRYTVTAQATSIGNLDVSAENLPNLEVAPPIGFNGPGDKWSPEDLLISAVSSCTILSFRAIARASKMAWVSLSCESSGVLERVDGKTKFTQIEIKALLVIAEDQSKEKAVKLLEKAEKTCLISNSLSATCHIECDVRFE